MLLRTKCCTFMLKMSRIKDAHKCRLWTHTYTHTHIRTPFINDAKRHRESFQLIKTCRTIWILYGPTWVEGQRFIDSVTNYQITSWPFSILNLTTKYSLVCWWTNPSLKPAIRGGEQCNMASWHYTENDGS